MRRGVKRLLWVGIPLAAIAFVTWQLPADFVLRRLPDHGVPLQYADAEGSIWSGSASQVRWRGLPLGSVNWKLQGPGEYPGISHRWAFDGAGRDYELDGEITLRGTQLERLSDVKGHIPAHWVDLSQVAPFLVLQGSLQIDLEEVQFENDRPQKAEGRIEWNQAGLGGLVEERLGEIRIDLDAKRRGTAFTLKSTQSAPLVFDGEGELSAGDYWLKLKIRASPERMPTLRELAHLGRLRGDTLTIEWSGQVLPE